jgi:hypothetical protein
MVCTSPWRNYIEEATTAKVVIKNRYAGKLFIDPLFRSALVSQGGPDQAFYLKADPIRIRLYATESRRIHADSGSGQALPSKKLFYINFSLFTR